MEATRARPAQTNTQAAPSAAQTVAPSAVQSARSAKAAAPPAGKAPLYAGAPAVRLSTSSPAAGAPQADVSGLVSAPGTGEPLRPEIQRALEDSMEVDLRPVRVHTDERSAVAANNLNARAFTYGPHIFLGSRASPADLSLMAHEVTHVIQQQGAPVLQMSTATAGSDTFEQEARQVSTTVQQGGQTTVTGRTGGPQVQKEENVPWYKRAARAVGRGVSAAGAAVVKGAEAVVEWGESVGWSLLNKYAPDLVPIIRQGVGEWLKEKISSAIETVFNTLMAPVRAVTGVVQSLMAHFSALIAWMREAASEIARGDCSAITKAVDKVQKVIEGIASPIIDKVKHLAQKVGNFFKGLWERFGVPIWDFLKKVGGTVWEKIQQFGNWVWEKTEPIRNLLKRAWKWIKDKLGVGDEPEGQNGLLQWVQKKAAAAWDWIKAKIEPIKKPLMVVGGVIVMLSPAGPIIAVGAAVFGLLKGIRWIRDHLNTPDGVVKNRDVFKDVIIPGIMNAVKAVTSKLNSVAASIIEKLNKVMGGLGDLVGAVGGSILRFAVSAVKWIADQFQGLVQWGSEKLHGLVDWIGNGLHHLHVFLQPVLDVLAKIGEIIVDILKLPALIAEKAWKMIPACIRDPFVNFLTNQILKRLPFFDQLVEIGEIWSKIKTGALTAIKQIFKDGNLKGAMITVFKTLLDILKVPIELVMAIFNKAASAIDLILANPKNFFINTLVAIKDGFFNFFTNIGKHLLKGAIDWLLSEIKDAGISVAGGFSDAWSIFKFILGMLGLSIENVIARLEKKLGKTGLVQKLKSIIKTLKGVWEWVSVLIKEGPAGLWTKIKEQVGNLKDMLLSGVIGWITENIINKAKKFILTRFNPAGIIITIVSVIVDIMKNLRKILEVVNAVLDSVAGIAKGATSAAAAFIEAAIGKVVPVIISFLADQLGLSGIGKRIHELLKKVREKVDAAIDWLIDKAISAGKAVLNTLGLGGKEKPTDEGKKATSEVDFDAAGEHHHVWIEVVNNRSQVMVASSPKDIDTFIKDSIEKPLKMPKVRKKVEDKKGIDFLNELDGELGEIKASAKQVEKVSADQKAILLRQLVEQMRILIKNISKFGEFPGIGKGRNIAIAYYKINQQSETVATVSGGEKEEPKVLEYIPGETPHNVFYTTYAVGHPRHMDTEVKILAYITDKFVNLQNKQIPFKDTAAPKMEPQRGVSGELYMASDFLNCGSCKFVIGQFKQTFPGIDLISVALEEVN